LELAEHLQATFCSAGSRPRADRGVINQQITIGEAAERIHEHFNPDLIIGIAGGGLFPARVLVSE